MSHAPIFLTILSISWYNRKKYRDHKELVVSKIKDRNSNEEKEGSTINYGALITMRSITVINSTKERGYHLSFDGKTGIYIDDDWRIHTYRQFICDNRLY